MDALLVSWNVAPAVSKAPGLKFDPAHDNIVFV
jgi:hypothetical protein